VLPFSRSRGTAFDGINIDVDYLRSTRMERWRPICSATPGSINEEEYGRLAARATGFRTASAAAAWSGVRSPTCVVELGGQQLEVMARQGRCSGVLGRTSSARSGRISILTLDLGLQTALRGEGPRWGEKGGDRGDGSPDRTILWRWPVARL